MKNETRHDKFKRLAETRTNKVLDMVDLIGNLSNKSSYDYTDEEVIAIFSAIEKAVAESKRKFKLNQPKKKKRFTL